MMGVIYNRLKLKASRLSKNNTFILFYYYK